jgi:hypothetical protein
MDLVEEKDSKDFKVKLGLDFKDFKDFKVLLEIKGSKDFKGILS